MGSHRGDLINFGASLNFADGMGNSNTIGFKSYHGDLGSHTEFKSEFTPPNIYQQVRMGTMGIDPSKNSSALTLHNLCSVAILGITNKTDKLSVGKVIRDITTLVKIGQPSTTTGRISFSDALIRDFKETNDIEDKPNVEDNKSKANTGGQMPDGDKKPEDDKDKKKDEKVKPYETGKYKDLKKRDNEILSDGEKMDIHHAPQQHPAKKIIKDYDPKNAPSIALPKTEHVQIPNIKGPYDGTPRDLMAITANNLRNYTQAPNNAVQEIIKLAKDTYPNLLKK